MALIEVRIVSNDRLIKALLHVLTIHIIQVIANDRLGRKGPVPLRFRTLLLCP